MTTGGFVLIVAVAVLVIGTRVGIAFAQGLQAGMHHDPDYDQPRRVAYRLGRHLRDRRDQMIRDALSAHRTKEHE